MAGPTGRFPLGMLNGDDEGELAIAVSDEDGNVRIDFGKAVSWIALTPEQAGAFAAAITHYASRRRQ